MIKLLRTLLPGIFAFFNTNRNLLLASSLLLALATATWVSSSNEKLKTDAAPCKIISLQLATNIHTSNTIAQSWSDAKVTNIALTSLRQDFAFILTYIVALMFSIMAFDKALIMNRWTIIFSLVTIIAGIADTVENIGCMLFILRKIHTNIFIFIPAYIKWIGLIISAAYIVLYFLFRIIRRIFINFTEHRWAEWFQSIHLASLGYLLKSIRIYLPGVITVLISYFLFIKVTQGQDVVIQITEYSGPFIWSLICIPLWAVFCWYSSRLVGYERLLQPGSGIPEEFHTHIPRLIAYNALISIQAAMLSIPTVGNLTEGGVWAFIIIQNLLYFFWDKILTGKPPVGYRAVSAVIVVAYIVTIIYLVNIGVYKHQKLLPIGAFFLFIFQMWLMRRFVERRKTIDPNPVGILSVSYMGLFRKSEWVRVPQNVREKEYWLFGRMFVIGCAGIVLFAAANISSYLADHMGPLPIVLLAFGVLVIMLNIGTIFSIRKGVNVFVVLIVWAFIIGKFYDPYKVRLIEVENASKVERPTLDIYFKNWINKRECILRDTATKTFPVYLVIADGGASRSGYWVASVLSKLQHASDTLRGNTFSDHLLVLAGASGGSVGNATFYALLKNDSARNINHLDSARKFLRQDFLSPVLAHWTGADLLNHIAPFHFDDRSTALEKTMEYHGKGVLKNAFAKLFSEVMDASGCLPILFINTTNVQEGAPAVISTIDISTFSKRVDVLDDVVKIDSPKVRDIRYSTAVVMGARFPYVSPAGNLGNRSFVDGGYFDNTGAGILHETMQELKRMIDNNATGIDPALLHKLKFQLIYLRNSSLRSTGPKPLQPLVNDLAAPIVTVLGTYGSQTDVNNLRLKTFMREFSDVEPIDINLYGSPDEEEFPMNWVISKYNLNRMDSNLNHRMKYVRLLSIERTGSVKECDCNRK
jgi:predicted acylesterase/phospholipase RssA